MTEIRTTRTNVSEVEVFQGDDDQWYFRGKAGNGETVVVSEGYTEKATADKQAAETFTDIPVSEPEE